MKPPIKIGNGAGFWGDNLDAPVRLAESGAVDVLTLEYLAELTLAILAHKRSRNPVAGFIDDFPGTLERLVPSLRAQEGLRIITNAGGLNPEACAVACGKVLEAAGMGELPIAVVRGDDVLDQLLEWQESGIVLDHLETGEPLSAVADRMQSANVYLGARPITDSLDAGAQLVLTGRVADASLCLGPAAHYHRWSWTDYDLLAGASVAGHAIECGAQATGGLWHAWADLPDLAGIGYPIAEVAADGSSIITKPEGSGGAVSVGTVTEQLLYEIDDPARYRTPDVDVDFTTLSVAEQGPDRVAIQGATGRAPSDRLKLAIVYRDGWTASGSLGVVGRDAEKKARAAGALVLARVARAGFTFAESLVECLGAGDIVPQVIRPRESPCEVILRVSVRHEERAAVERFCREFAPLATSGPPGIVGYASGRPVPRPALGYWPALLPRSLVCPMVEINAASAWAAARVTRGPEACSLGGTV